MFMHTKWHIYTHITWLMNEENTKGFKGSSVPYKSKQLHFNTIQQKTVFINISFWILKRTYYQKRYYIYLVLTFIS